MTWIGFLALLVGAVAVGRTGSRFRHGQATVTEVRVTATIALGVALAQALRGYYVLAAAWLVVGGAFLYVSIRHPFPPPE